MNGRFTNVIFPIPKYSSFKSDTLSIGVTGECLCFIDMHTKASDVEIAAVNILKAKILEKIGTQPEVFISGEKQPADLAVIKIDIVDLKDSFSPFTEDHDEGYHLVINEAGVKVYGNSAKGVFYAVQTLIQLMFLEKGLMLPFTEIRDWPDIKYRGLFVEDRYGSDRMTLDDWKAFVDYMASLKMNFLGIGVYGCWCIQYNNMISEFMYLPLKSYPDLKTPSITRYFSVLEKNWKTVDSLPEMYKNDFFGEIITYAGKRNITVRPHFNSLGHNTLIPRLYPEISAKDSNGISKGFSFCTCNGKTYELLFSIYDEIIDRYLRPNQIEWFHIGMDEVWSMIGVDNEEPFKEFDPWCKCSMCSNKSHEELIMEYIIKLAKHLKEKGIKNITIWHDQLFKMGLLNEEFVKQLKDEDLLGNLVINWWRYWGEPIATTLPQLGIRTFVSPMAGYFHWMLTDSYLENIYGMMNVGHSEGVEGSEAYCIYDFSYDRNYCGYSEYTWNRTAGKDIEAFRDDYIRKRFPDGYTEVKEAFYLYDKFVEPGEKRDLMLMTLSYYVYSYVRKGKNYPRNFPGEVFSLLLEDESKYTTLLKEVFVDSCKAYNIFDKVSESIGDIMLINHYKADCLSFRTLANEYLALIGMKTDLEDPELLNCDRDEVLSKIRSIIEKVTSLKTEREKQMLFVEMTKAKYLIPSELRNFSIHRQYLICMEAYLKGIMRDVEKGLDVPVPLIDIRDMRNVEDRMFALLR